MSETEIDEESSESSDSSEPEPPSAIVIGDDVPQLFPIRCGNPYHPYPFVGKVAACPQLGVVVTTSFDALQVYAIPRPGSSWGGAPLIRFALLHHLSLSVSDDRTFAMRKHQPGAICTGSAFSFSGPVSSGYMAFSMHRATGPVLCVSDTRNSTVHEIEVMAGEHLGCVLETPAALPVWVTGVAAHSRIAPGTAGDFMLAVATQGPREPPYIFLFTWMERGSAWVHTRSLYGGHEAGVLRRPCGLRFSACGTHVFVADQERETLFDLDVHTGQLRNRWILEDGGPFTDVEVLPGDVIVATIPESSRVVTVTLPLPEAVVGDSPFAGPKQLLCRDICGNRFEMAKTLSWPASLASIPGLGFLIGDGGFLYGHLVLCSTLAGLAQYSMSPERVAWMAVVVKGGCPRKSSPSGLVGIPGNQRKRQRNL